MSGLNIRKFVGRAPEQTEEFLASVAAPILEENAALLGLDAQVRV